MDRDFRNPQDVANATPDRVERSLARVLRIGFETRQFVYRLQFAYAGGRTAPMLYIGTLNRTWNEYINDNARANDLAVGTCELGRGPTGRTLNKLEVTSGRGKRDAYLLGSIASCATSTPRSSTLTRRMRRPTRGVTIPKQPPRRKRGRPSRATMQRRPPAKASISRRRRDRCARTSTPSRAAPPRKRWRRSRSASRSGRARSSPRRIWATPRRPNSSSS